jgi:serpin B
VGLWVPAGQTVLPEFAGLARRAYLARAQSLPGDPGKAAQDIGEWVLRQTGGKISPTQARGEAGALMLACATRFQGAWSTPFPSQATRPGNFFADADKPTKVPFLSHPRLCARRLEVPGKLTALELPYGRGEASMVLLLPDAHSSLAALEQSLNEETLSGWRRDLRKAAPKELSVSLPRFRMQSLPAVQEALGRLKLRAAFVPKSADFSGITGSRELFLSRVIHAAAVDVNESGTEAASVTQLVFERGDSFSASRPFFFLIVDNRHDLILFAGRFINPATAGY